MSDLQFTVYKGSPSGDIVEDVIHRQALEGRQVLIRITHSGICGTDEHYRTTDMVLGHEGVGFVEALGPQAALLNIGDRVGWGYCHGSCRSCGACLPGKELYCRSRRLYGEADLDQGSFASHAVWDEDFVFLVPKSISSAAAAPLMCAGAAVYSALQRACVRPANRVGVLGLGGLGHLAVQFAARMGCEVIVYSRSASKEQEALALGAAEFYHGTNGGDSVASPIPEPVDCLLVTAAQQPAWSSVIPRLRRGGTISVLTVDTVELCFKELPLLDSLMNAIQIQCSLPAPRKMHSEMLRFAAIHQIAPIVELFPLTQVGIDEAVGKLRSGSLRYRAVLEVSRRDG